MTRQQLEQYDRFLDENDWDIYYWATQEPSPTSRETAEGAGPDNAATAARGTDAPDAWSGQPPSGEWAQTIGRFKPAYRPVPQRWRNSKVLALLRKHVLAKSAGGVGDAKVKDGQQNPISSALHVGGGGLGRMPSVQNFGD